MKEKKSHFIPSDFKVVTQYEDIFVREWKVNNANAVAEVIKYIASVTADAIKGGKL